MTYDLTPAQAIPPAVLRAELLVAQAKAHQEHERDGRSSATTIERVREIVAITETQLTIELARLP